jgi:hypothetical protein
VEAKEVPEPLRQPIERLVRIADLDGDGKLTQDEFVTATEQMSRFLRRGRPDQMRQRDRKMDRKPKADEAASPDKKK